MFFQTLSDKYMIVNTNINRSHHPRFVALRLSIVHKCHIQSQCQIVQLLLYDCIVLLYDYFYYCYYGAPPPRCVITLVFISPTVKEGSTRAVLLFRRRAGWNTICAHTNLRHAAANPKKLLLNTANHTEMRVRGQMSVHHCICPKCEDGVSEMKWLCFESYFSVSLGVAWQRHWVVSKVVG